MAQSGDIVVVTGASAGVGRAIAREFAKRGATIALLARGRAGLEGARADVERLGGRALVIPTDVADDQQVEAAAERVERELGPMDIWVNNAMTTIFSPVDQVTAEEFRRATQVTYLGTVYGTLSALRRMKPRDRGTIVQVGSALAYRSIPLQAPYCGAKFAIRGFTDALRCELIHDRSNIHLTMVQLPGLNTPQFSWCKTKLPRHPQPVPPIFQPEVAARGVVWAAYHWKREVYVGRSTVMAIWGSKFVQPWLDQKLAFETYEGQQTDQPNAPDRVSNLMEPADEQHDYGAHGIFDSRATSFSPQWWASSHRGWIAAGTATAAGLLTGLLLTR